MDPETQKAIEFGLVYDQNRLLPFVAFFQTSNEGQGCAYMIQAPNDIAARGLISEYCECMFGEDAGDVMVYTPAELRDLADHLEKLQRGEIGPDDDGWDIAPGWTPEDGEDE